MDTYLVVGIEMISYVSKSTNKKVEGARIYCTFDFKPDTDSDGVGCEQFFVKKDIAEKIEVGYTIEPCYNKYGSIVNINIIKED